MKSMRPILAGVLALALATAGGCDWLKGSGGGTRESPFLSGLSFTRSSMLCDQPFGIAFDYDDPQDDISVLRISFQHATSSRQRERQALWDDSGDLSLATAGRAVYTFAFSCSDPGGRWMVDVEVEDLKGHVSNTLRGEVTLTSAGQ